MVAYTAAKVAVAVFLINDASHYGKYIILYCYANYKDQSMITFFYNDEFCVMIHYPECTK